MRTETEELKHTVIVQQHALELLGKALANRSVELAKSMQLLDTGKVIVEELIARLDGVQTLMMETHNSLDDTYTLKGEELRNLVQPGVRKT